tara:strand:+ start:460 stop:711 length:252 start_codon:yes stop_codon:yes gene_type:complete
MYEKIKKIPQYLKDFWYWFKGLFITYYELKVSYNSTWGDADDQIFVVSKFFKKQEKYIKFKTQEGEIVEVRGAEGLNYRIKQL